MSEPLQFDRADDDVATPGAAVRVCASCQMPIVDQYYALGAKLLCVPCHGKVLATLDARFAGGSVGAALLRGGGAALLGAVISYTFTAITDIQLGLVAILIGYLVGKGVAQGAHGKGGLGYQALAVGLTYLSIALSYAPYLYKSGPMDHVFASAIAALVMPVLVVFKLPLTALINGFAFYEAWKLNRTPKLPITGPHLVAAPPLHV